MGPKSFKKKALNKKNYSIYMKATFFQHKLSYSIFETLFDWESGLHSANVNPVALHIACTVLAK